MGIHKRNRWLPISSAELLEMAWLRLFALVLTLSTLPQSTLAEGVEPVPIAAPSLQPPPPAPPVQAREGTADRPPLASALEGLTLYSIGEPSDEEQLYVELINRARANPGAEALRLRDITDPEILNAFDSFSVDLDQMVADISALEPAPPLSIEARLLAAARQHSLDMFTNAFQGHIGSDGSEPSDRITAAGYWFSMLGENVYASVKSVGYGHAGFEVDWGPGPGGMQSPPGHRLNIHERSFREIGVGVVLGSNGGVGPQLVTQDFGARAGLGPYVTGAVYHDLNGNGSYDLGEGLGGVEVTATGSSYYAVTANSGGYSVPVPARRSLTVTFRAAGISDHQRTVTVQDSNLKVDHIVDYDPPVVSGPDPTFVGLSNRMQFTAVGGAIRYEWERARREAFTAIEGAEQGLANVTAIVSPDYEVIVSNVRTAGFYAFHLAHPQPVSDQVLLLNRRLIPSSNSFLKFYSRLTYATPNQVATAQVSTNGGETWQTVWSRAGTGTSGQILFHDIQVPLDFVAGQVVEVRFLYGFLGGTFYDQTSIGVGWYLDRIRITEAAELLDLAVRDVDPAAGFGFDFVPDQQGDYTLRVRGATVSRQFNWGPALLTSAVPPPTQIRIRGTPVLLGNRVTLEFELASGAASTFSVETATDPAGPWSLDGTATIQTLVPGSRFGVEAAVGAGQKGFYRIVAE